MTVFELPGAALSVELSDEGGHPVVQLHGLTSSRARDRVLDLDLGRGLSGTRLLRYDARGHGRSTGSRNADDYLWPNLAGDLLTLLDGFFPGERVYGVGTSMGSGTLMHAAIKDPDRFAGLTLLLPPTAWETRVAQAQQYLANAALIEEQGESPFLAAGRDAPQPPAAVGHPETLPEVAEALLPSVYRGAAGSDLPDPADLARIDIPVRILAWVDDPSHPMSTATTLADVFGQSTLTVAESPRDVRRWPGLLLYDVSRLN
ncbi:MAG TPA: alpha/beta hydrolase [Gordonia sp. (in: high G+C Gram-positive bacteria)]|uniref:alpha/beta fold hydrolase n=1 Tax=unclassified Gordonia (in: high G+C Gram-positive bacteria) TaxID=2657482 RepID=UPI000F984735|nr:MULTISPECIES: alpha/beta hydrolase [unclassified Gordonia (in: high G+C Gram-positive bacteria)]RUP36776.1 MAG: alpha/beta hydrolase [Gordonia sp. (in: high G+C Gram-positive bacteria)]HNP56970.1 alpha/beta hydrolase [Gordonia sp. (in: high G+C Gram-positive bacteria)]HRC50414.1 alpha/beta hydrolase [Gordonia sp. (in: high G+C Gram-positive bacteria)]